MRSSDAQLKGKKIAVVGAGAVGCYYGGVLAEAGHDVHFLMRSDLKAVRARGMNIHTKGRVIHLEDVQCAATSAEIGPVDLVLIALKTTANSALNQLLPPLLKENTALLTLQNGLGNEEFLAANWGLERVLGALCFVCINRAAPGEIHHLDHGSISIGEFRRTATPRAKAIAKAFEQADVEAQAVDNLAGERWRKLLWNVPFNGFSVALGATVRDVLHDPELRSLARDLMGELLEAARALGHPIPEDYADWQIERSYSMGAYKPSSMIDYEAGNPVEVEAIWGEPLRHASRAGVSMPRLELLYRVIRHLAAQRMS